METRKVQRLGPSTLAMTLPAEWAKEQNVEKGDEVSLRMGGKGTLTVLPESASTEDAEATLHADNLDADALERAILAQYVLGRRVINITTEDGALDSDHINAVYKAETQLMGLGVIEETPENIAIRCSVDPEDFTLDNLLERLENTGSTMRGEAVKALAHGNADLAQRVALGNCVAGGHREAPAPHVRKHDFRLSTPQDHEIAHPPFGILPRHVEIGRVVLGRHDRSATGGHERRAEDGIGCRVRRSPTCRAQAERPDAEEVHRVGLPAIGPEPRHRVVEGLEVAIDEIPRSAVAHEIVPWPKGIGDVDDIHRGQALA